jgi:hypothetical protein
MGYEPIRGLIDPYYPEFYSPQFSYGSEIRRLYYYLRFQNNYFKQQIASGDIPILGTFQQDSPEVGKMWCYILGESEHMLGVREKPPLSKWFTIISLDCGTGKLYAGFTDIYFLRKDFPKRTKNGMLRQFFSFLAPVKQSDGSAYYVQNATGEKFLSGDTILTFVDTLSSSDIESIVTKSSINL